MQKFSGLRIFGIALFFVALIVGPRVQAGDDPSFIAFHVGGYDVNDDETAGQFNLEYRSGWDDWYLKPFAGVMTTTDAAIYGYLGVMLDIYLGRRLVLTPNFAAGLYSDGDGKDLGHVVEFRSGIELAYRFDNRTRLGISFHHISNAGLDDVNPGTETLTLVLSLPLNNLFSD